MNEREFRKMSKEVEADAAAKVRFTAADEQPSNLSGSVVPAYPEQGVTFRVIDGRSYKCYDPGSRGDVPDAFKDKRENLVLV